MIDLCVNTIQPLLQPKVRLKKEVDDNIGIVYSDQDKIRQIILNLLSNAAKFTHRGVIKLVVKKESENLEIIVSDTGIGIRSEDLPNIFKEFEQADATTTRKYGGTGLGLTISRNLSRLLGGDLTVKSEFGQGSTFTLLIPTHYERHISQIGTTAPTSSNIQPVRDPEEVESTDTGFARKRVLVIDDDPDAVYLLKENLDQQDFEVRGCLNGQDGIRMAQELQPQAILLDILMPGADGWQILHDLKSNPRTVEIPVILHTVVDKKTLGFQLGASAYLLKPLDPVVVREVLDQVTGQAEPHSKRLLVVDDDPNVTDMLRQFLEETEYILESEKDGLGGLEAIRNNRPDILLLDLMMPGLDGFGVIEKLRADPQTRDLPIIVISAKDLTANERTWLNEKVESVIKKQGFQGSKFVEEILRILRLNP